MGRRRQTHDLDRQRIQQGLRLACGGRSGDADLRWPAGFGDRLQRRWAAGLRRCRRRAPVARPGRLPDHRRRVRRPAAEHQRHDRRPPGPLVRRHDVLGPRGHDPHRDLVPGRRPGHHPPGRGRHRAVQRAGLLTGRPHVVLHGLDRPADLRIRGQGRRQPDRQADLRGDQQRRGRSRRANRRRRGLRLVGQLVRRPDRALRPARQARAADQAALQADLKPDLRRERPGRNLRDHRAQFLRGPYAPPGYDFDHAIGGPLLRVRGTGVRGRTEHVCRLG